LKQINADAEADETTLRMSVDAKGTILLALLSRGGFNLVITHIFKSKEKASSL
jgi:hypothetical protein